MKRLILHVAGLIFLAGCSTTKHLPEGEILYTGQKPMVVLNRSETPRWRDCYGRGGGGSCHGAQ